jgi:hypothetical protein
MSTHGDWKTPAYIAEGLEWLAEQICPPSSELPVADIVGDIP